MFIALIFSLIHCSEFKTKEASGDLLVVTCFVVPDPLAIYSSQAGVEPPTDNPLLYNFISMSKFVLSVLHEAWEKICIIGFIGAV